MAETIWIAPQPVDLVKVLSYELQQASNQNVAATLSDIANLVNAPYDVTASDRRSVLLAVAVNEFRGAINAGGRVPLSNDPTTIPPECERHLLNLAAYGLVNGDLNLKSVLVVTEGGVYSPFNKGYEAAMKELARLRSGDIVTPPSDPQPQITPLYGGGGAIYGEWDMTTSDQLPLATPNPPNV